GIRDLIVTGVQTCALPIFTLDRRGENARLSTYLGGSGADYGYAITIGSGNSIWFGGSTTSMDFPLVRASQDAYAGGPFDAFLGKIGRASCRERGSVSDVA